jgi:hypothetical protein
MLLKICNHQLKLNAQLRHYATDEHGVRIRPECTFYTISNEENREKETYKHFFLECKHSKNTLKPIARRYNIPLPNVQTKGELILYYFPWEGKWDETCINVYYAIFEILSTIMQCKRWWKNLNHIFQQTSIKVRCNGKVKEAKVSKLLREKADLIQKIKSNKNEKEEEDLKNVQKKITDLIAEENRSC